MAEERMAMRGRPGAFRYRSCTAMLIASRTSCGISVSVMICCIPRRGRQTGRIIPGMRSHTSVSRACSPEPSTKAR